MYTLSFLCLILTAQRDTVLPSVIVFYVSQEGTYSSTCLPLPDGGNPSALPFHLLVTIRLILYSSWKTICDPFFIRVYLVHPLTRPSELKES